MVSEILILGSIILVGFVGTLLFKYTKVPESLFMMLIGLAIGPVFGVVSPAQFQQYLSLVVTITLIIVLLDTGLSMNVVEMFSVLKKALCFTLLVMVFCTLFVSGFLYLIGWEPLHALFMGIISSGTTTIVTLFLLSQLKAPKEVKDILLIESIINDLTILTLAVVVLQVMELQTIDLTLIGSLVLAPVVFAILAGGVFTFLWVEVLRIFYTGRELTYVFTIGFLFIIYALVESVGGNGTISVLVLSASLGNLPLIFGTFFQEESTRKDLTQRFNQVSRYIKNTQVNFSFFIRNFFFVYLGIVFDMKNVNPTVFGYCLLILAIVLVSRYVSFRIFTYFEHKLRKHGVIMTVMVARGFTATFAALLPSTRGIEIPHIKEITLLMVFISTLTTIIGSILRERKLGKKIDV